MISWLVFTLWMNCVILSKIHYVHKLINFKLNFAMIAILGMPFSSFVMFDEFCQVDLKAWTKGKKSVSTSNSAKSFLLFSTPYFLVYDFFFSVSQLKRGILIPQVIPECFQVFAVWASVGSTSVLIKSSTFCIWTHYEFWNSAHKQSLAPIQLISFVSSVFIKAIRAHSVLYVPFVLHSPLTKMLSRFSQIPQILPCIPQNQLSTLVCINACP